MQRLHRYLGSFLMGAVLIAPVGAMANAFEEHHNCPNSGYYDRDHKDCHGWDDTKTVPTRPGSKLITKQIGNSPS